MKLNWLVILVLLLFLGGGCTASLKTGSVEFGLQAKTLGGAVWFDHETKIDGIDSKTVWDIETMLAETIDASKRLLAKLGLPI